MIRSQVPEIDLEVSIDEGVRTTTPEDHLYCAEFLLQTGVEFTSLAPKFPGEFQKGIDFIGDISAFKNDLFIHAGIADRIGGYRLSLHSGSDKFSIYPIWAEATKGNYHVKTSGTSWLQAVKLICRTDLPLYQTLYKTCLDELTESKKAYHVFIEHSDFPAKLPSDIEAFCDNNNVRQLFHISYGALLYAHRSEIYECLRRNEAQHKALVEEHIQKHLTLLFPDK